MANKLLDVIIFGATGYTGKYVVEHFFENVRNKYKWAIAGRSESRLKKIVDDLNAKQEPGANNFEIGVIVADCSDEASINGMCSRAKLVVNCCGPYRFYGEVVVKACVKYGTHYVDVCGEPEFIENMLLKYNDQAAKSGSYIVNACGFDSIPAELSVIHFKKNFPGLVNSIDSYMKISSPRSMVSPLLNATTWESAVHSFANQRNLGEIRKKLREKFGLKSLRLEPKSAQKTGIHRSEIFDEQFAVPFPGADRSVVGRSQDYAYLKKRERPIQYNTFMICESALVLVALYFVQFFLQIFTRYRIGKGLLLKFPGIFSLGLMSRGGPSRQIAANTEFCMRLVGYGWSEESVNHLRDKLGIKVPLNTKMITEAMCLNPAYGFTADCLVFCALAILEEPFKLPESGGVYTPGVAFGKTSLLNNLNQRGFEIKILHVDKAFRSKY